MIEAMEILKDAVPIITRFAPTVANAFLGNFSFGLNFLIPALARAFGLAPNDISNLVQKIISDEKAPDILSKMESEHKDWISKLIPPVQSLSKAEVSIKMEFDN